MLRGWGPGGGWVGTSKIPSWTRNAHICLLLQTASEPGTPMVLLHLGPRRVGKDADQTGPHSPVQRNHPPKGTTIEQAEPLQPPVHPLVTAGTEKGCYCIPRREHGGGNWEVEMPVLLLRRPGFYTDMPLGLGTSQCPSLGLFPHLYNKRLRRE